MIKPHPVTPLPIHFSSLVGHELSIIAREKIVLRDLYDPREVVRLQEESGNGEKASEASARDSDGLVTTVGDDTAGGWGADGSGGAASANWVGGGGDRVDGSGRVDVGWRADSRGGAGHGAGGVHWLGDGVGTGGQGHGAGSSDGVGLAVVADLSGLRAVGNVGRGDLGSVANSVIASGSDGGREGKDGDRELHVDGIKCCSSRRAIEPVFG